MPMIMDQATDCLTFGYEDAAKLLRSVGFESVEVLTGKGFETQPL